MVALRLILHPEIYALTRTSERPVLANDRVGRFSGVARLGDEWTAVCEERLAPGGGNSEAGYRLIEIEGPFALDSTGVVAAVVSPLAQAGIGLFAFSVWSADAVLVRDGDLARAVRVLKDAGHAVREAGRGPNA